MTVWKKDLRIVPSDKAKHISTSVDFNSVHDKSVRVMTVHYINVHFVDILTKV